MDTSTITIAFRQKNDLIDFYREQARLNRRKLSDYVRVVLEDVKSEIENGSWPPAQAKNRSSNVDAKS